MERMSDDELRQKRDALREAGKYGEAFYYDDILRIRREQAFIRGLFDLTPEEFMRKTTEEANENEDD